MNIPWEAVEAASNALWDDRGIPCSTNHLSIALQAAAPLIAAQALRDASARINTHQFGPAAAPYLSAIKAQVRADADEMDPQ